MGLPVDDLATFAQTAAVGTIGTDLFRFGHTTSPDLQAALIPYGGLPSEQAFGEDDLKWEFPRIQVSVRGNRNDDRAAATLAHAYYVAFGKIGAESLSGTFYHGVTCLQPPFRLGSDDNDRPLWVFNLEVEKEVAA